MRLQRMRLQRIKKNRTLLITNDLIFFWFDYLYWIKHRKAKEGDGYECCSEVLTDFHEYSGFSSDDQVRVN